MKTGRAGTNSGAPHLRFSGAAFLAAIAFSLVSLPVSAARSDSMSWKLHGITMIGTAQVNPGNYLFRAKEGQPELQILQDGKVIANVPCSWTRLAKKAPESQIIIINSQMTQVQFSGRKDAIQLNP